MHRLYEGDCRDVLPTLPDASVDAVVCDPPYPCIGRDYGTWTVEEWFALMDEVVPQCRRVLKPKGSAVFILQPNSERVGRMRTWLLEFIVKWAKAWGWVQDVYWWNVAAQPTGHTQRHVGLCRSSVKLCVWLGAEDCYRNQGDVLWTESQANVALRAVARCARTVCPSGHSVNEKKMSGAALDRGGVTPFNLLPVANTDSVTSAGAHGHGAGTPTELMRWWVRYLVPPRGVVLDPFAGSGTCAVAAACEGRDSVLVERNADYCNIIRKRLADLAGPLFASAPSGPPRTPD